MSVVANVAINVDSSGAVSKLRQVQTQAQQTERAFGGIAAAATKLAVAFGGIQAAKFIFVKTAELESQTRSLQVLTGSAEKAGQIIKELQQLGAVTPFTSTELIDSAKRLQAFGVEADKVVETTKRLADVSGATGAELSGLVTAYGQVQAKGRLQGEELLQFQERGVALQAELRKMYGLSGEEFQKALEKGRIGSEAVEVAILRLTSAGGKYANGAIAQSDTLNGRLSTLQDSIGVLAQTIGNTLAPVFQWALTQATAVVSEIQRVIDEANNTGGARNREAQFARNADAAVRGMGLNPFTQQGMMADMRQRNIEQQRADYRLRQQAARTPSAPVPMGVPALLGGGGGGRAGGAGGGASKAASDAKRAADEAKRAAEQIQQQLKAADDINFALKNRLAIAQTTEPVAKRMLEYDIKQNEIAKEYDELKKAAKGADELALINANLIIEQRIAQIEYEQEINGLLAERAILMADIVRQASMPTVYNELKTQEAALQGVLDKYPAIGAAADAAATMVTSGIAAMIAGTQSAEQVFVEFLSSIADALINTAKQMIAQYIAIGIAKIFAGMGGGGGGGFAPSGELAAVGNVGTGFNFDAGAMLPAFRANGGPVTSQQPYMVGERGTELFVPGSNGGVMSNNDLRSAMNGQGGGAAGSPVLNMSFESTTIGGVEYVSRDQLEQAMAETRRTASRDGAQRGMTMTLDRIQNSSSTRRRIGV